MHVYRDIAFYINAIFRVSELSSAILLAGVVNLHQRNIMYIHFTFATITYKNVHLYVYVWYGCGVNVYPDIPDGFTIQRKNGRKNGFIMQTLRVIRCNSFFLREINKRTFIYIGKF